MSAIDLLELWRSDNGADCTWSVSGPSKGVRPQRYTVTLYEYRSPKWRNEAHKGGDTLLDAAHAAISLWEERKAA